jgi:glutamine amidotransferase-like uncharacterized protein
MDVRGHREFIAIVTVTLFLLSPLHVSLATAQTIPRDLSGVNIALYHGDASSSTSSRTALQSMFSWMNASVDILYASDINEGDLANYDMIAIPGGWAGTYNVDLAGKGITEIRSFVEDGGAFFGVCAGAYFACDKLRWESGFLEYQLDLYAGYGVGPIEEIADWPNYDMAEIAINQTSPLIDLTGEPANHSVMYYGGPWFEITDQEGIHTLATYTANNRSAMIAFEYEEGRVFLSGPHPEWEEDSDRDGSSWENGFDDKGSEWNMMLSVALWLVESQAGTTETTSRTTDHTPPPDLLGVTLIVIGATGAALVLLFYLRNRAK